MVYTYILTWNFGLTAVADPGGLIWQFGRIHIFLKFGPPWWVKLWIR